MQVILLEKITHLGDLGDIAQAVDNLGFQIKKSQVRTPLGAIKATGEYVITIGLMTAISADVTVKVVAEE